MTQQLNTIEPHQNTEERPKTIFKAIYWSLFGAGGMICALILPVLILILSFGLPFYFISNPMAFYAKFHGLFNNAFFFFIISGVLFLMLWHCVHRFYYCLHDCQIKVGIKTRWALYSFAIGSFLLTLIFGF